MVLELGVDKVEELISGDVLEVRVVEAYEPLEGFLECVFFPLVVGLFALFQTFFVHLGQAGCRLLEALFP